MCVLRKQCVFHRFACPSRLLFELSFFSPFVCACAHPVVRSLYAHVFDQPPPQATPNDMRSLNVAPRWVAVGVELRIHGE